MIGEYVSDAKTLVAVLAALAALVAFLGYSAILHRRRLQRIPVRVHVAGTRGKSSTTRLIAAGLRAGGLRVVAKTTGSTPRLILPDGSEELWPRRGRASIREQARFVSVAARARADAVVLECMAVDPDLQWASEHYFVQATIGVITNARPDHLEELGPDPELTARGLTAMVPYRALLVLTDESASDVITARAGALGTDVRVVGTSGLGPLESNRALALAVCEALGVAPATAAAGMAAARPDPGAFSVDWIEVEGKRVRFANAFACNDARSAELLWREACADGVPPAVVLLNARRDRPLRTRQFLEFLVRRAPPVTLVLTGDPLAKRLARAAGFADDRVRTLRTDEPQRALKTLVEAAAPGGIIWGMGNYAGLGERITDTVRRRTLGC